MAGSSGSVGAPSPATRWGVQEYVKVTKQMSIPLDGSGWVDVTWRTSADGTSAIETFAADKLVFNVTPGFAEDILPGSVRFKVGNRTYIDRQGSLYHSVDSATGAGILAGGVQYQGGLVTLDDWPPNATNAMTLESLVTEINVQPIDEVVFRIPVAPVRTGSVQIRSIPLEGTNGEVTSVTAKATGEIESNFSFGSVNYQTGVVRVKFGQKVDVTPWVEAQPWFSEVGVWTEAGVRKTVYPRPVYADSIRYNAVGYTYLPLNADILGLDPVRLPSDGRVPIYRPSDLVIVHNTQDLEFPSNPAVGTVLDVGRVRVSSIRVVDAENASLPDFMYKTDLDAGLVTLTSDFVLGDFMLPLFAEHRIEDMAVVTDVQINGVLALSQPLSHEYPADSSYVSSSLIIADMQTRVFNKFSQQSWTGEWSDSIIGNETLSQYNDTLYPIKVQNADAIEEKWVIIFTSATAFRVVGKSVGQIATGSTGTDTKPLNPTTGRPYWELRALGWGDGWAAGNVLRFNTAGANYPLWLIRTRLQGPATELSDSFTIQARGDVDR